jgi:hypothetical protein
MKPNAQVRQNERALEKDASRRQDERDLSSGEKLPEELRRENGHFAGMRVRLRLELAKALY